MRPFTVGQNNKEPRCKYWATHSSICSFARSLHPLLARGKMNDWMAFFSVFFPLLDHNTTVLLPACSLHLSWSKRATAELASYLLAHVLKTKTIQQRVDQRVEHDRARGSLKDEVAFGNTTEKADHQHGQGQITEHTDRARAADVGQDTVRGMRRRRRSAFRTHHSGCRIFIF